MAKTNATRRAATALRRADAKTAVLGGETPKVSRSRISSDEDLIGREILGQYVITKKLGAGGMGAVFLADQVTVGRPAVIKVLRPQLAGSPEVAARFAIEAKAASALNHPNIVTIYNYGAMDDGTLFLAMEYLDGLTVEQLLQQLKRIPSERAVGIISQVARALAEAHRRGVVHRDLKPSNIMVMERAGGVDSVKVLDFGIAKLDGVGMTSTGEIFGTPPYMSPEQLRGQPLDGRSDLYSAGIVMYEMLTGKLPFESEEPIGWIYKHVTETPKSPSEVVRRAKIPPAVEALVLRALAKTPDERGTSMEQWAIDLERSLAVPAAEPTKAAAAAPTIAKLTTGKRTTGKATGEKTPTGKRANGKSAPAKSSKPPRAASAAGSVKATVYSSAASALRSIASSPAGVRDRVGRLFRRKQRDRFASFFATTRGRIVIAAFGVGVVALVVVLLAAGDATKATPPSRNAPPAARIDKAEPGAATSAAEQRSGPKRPQRPSTKHRNASR